MSSVGAYGDDVSQPFFGTGQPWNVSSGSHPTTLLPEVHHGSAEHRSGPVARIRDAYSQYDHSHTPPNPGTPRGSAETHAAAITLPDGPLPQEEEGMPQGWGPRLIVLDSRMRIMRTHVDDNLQTINQYIANSDQLNAGVIQRLNAIERTLLNIQLNNSARRHSQRRG